jgi:hypothetical protein
MQSGKHSCKSANTNRVFLAFFIYFLKMLGLKGLYSDPQFLFRGSKRPLPKMRRTNEKAKNAFLFCFAKMLKGQIRGFQIGPMNMENNPVVQRKQKGFWFQWYVQL